MRFAIFLGVAVGIITAFASVFLGSGQTPVFQGKTNAGIAQTIFDTCANESYAPSCYDTEIPKLMDEGYSMEQAFDVTRIVQEMDPSYQYCHVLGHYLAGKETQKDPENWKDVIARTPLGMCSNGAIHGAFQERFRAESLPEGARDVMITELEDICEPRADWQATGMGVATCKHALGHLTMYATDGEVEDSVLMCNELLDGNNTHMDRQLCYDGAFMQIFQPLEPEDFALIVGKEIETIDEAEKFCSGFDPKYRVSCIGESWPLYRDLISAPETVLASCQQLPEGSTDFNRCMSGIFYVAMAQANLSVQWAGDFCTKVPKQVSGLCFANSSSRLIETDSRNVAKSLEVCRLAEQAGEGKACYDELLKYSGFIFKYSDPEYVELCNGLPEQQKQKCLSPISIKS
jgi:hypothetical protein